LKTQRDYWNELAQYGQHASVIDPNDTLGRKNAYIMGLRDRALLEVIRPQGQSQLILDFGCGSGNISRLLAAYKQRVVGIDIAQNLLRYATQGNDGCVFLRYDGQHLPLLAETFGVAVCYVVLGHITSDTHLLRVLRQIHDVLRPHGHFIAIEQTRRRRTVCDNGYKVQRTRREYCTLFAESGLHVTHTEDIRSGHFPVTYLLRRGWFPPRLFPWLAILEKRYCRLMPSPVLDYRDTVFVLQRPDNPQKLLTNALVGSEPVLTLPTVGMPGTCDPYGETELC
jgi:SAM-dependent methyltransferase